MTEEIFRTDSYARTCAATVTAVADGGIVLDRTVFYPTGGGQPGDVGRLVRADGTQIMIADTRKDRQTGAILHVPEDDAPALDAGTAVRAEIDWDRRYRHMRMHTGMHLLCALVEAGVTGGSVGAAKSRLDFDIAESPDKAALNAALNDLIVADHPVNFTWITDAEMDANAELVRTMSVQPPRGSGQVRLVGIKDVDLQPCGGTHVKSTGEIGPLRIGKIENKGKRNRRINILFDE